jgi:glycosyltransferase involved in cell wall biosynthesis
LKTWRDYPIESSRCCRNGTRSQPANAQSNSAKVFVNFDPGTPGRGYDKPEISVVIAAWPDLRGLTQCLQSLAEQRDREEEVIVASPADFSKELRVRFPWVRWLKASTDRLIPHLWSLGIENARGNIVAITTAHFVPALDWLQRIREAHSSFASAGIGGAIDPPRGGTATDWATYFLRYSDYLNVARNRVANEIPGDNASYKRDSLIAHQEAIGDSFWELDFHRLLRAEGKTLMLVPAIRVKQCASFGFRRFVLQRLQHGRQFGQSRRQREARAVQLARIIASPLIPLVFLAKIVRRVMASRRDYGPFLLSLPVLVIFITAWTIGEVWGYCRFNSNAPHADLQQNASA